MKTSFPAYREYPGSPVDVFKLQGDHFAGPQAQPRQKKKDGPIPATGGNPGIASANNLFDLFGLEELRHLREPPCGHGRNGPGEIAPGLSVLEEETKEGAQRGHHEFGHSRGARPGVAKLMKVNRAAAKALDQKVL